MSYKDYDLSSLIEVHKKLIYEDKKRLGYLRDLAIQRGIVSQEKNEGTSNLLNFRRIFFSQQNFECFQDEEPVKHSEVGDENSADSTTDSETDIFQPQSDERQEEFSEQILTSSIDGGGQNFPLVERLDLSSCNGSLEKDKQAFIDKLENSENPLSFRSDEGGGGTMLRYGEFSPNNPQLRVAALPYLGLGEYEQRRQFISKQRQADYKEHISRKNDLIKNKVNNFFVDSRPEGKLTGYCKAVQTDIQNIHNKLVQYELHSQNPPEKELSPQPVYFESDKMHNSRSPILGRADQRLTSTQNTLLSRPETSKPKSILSTRRTETPRDLHHSYVPSILDGFSYQDKTELLEKERLKRESYQSELRQQIEEKRRLSALRDEQERREQELENRRFEQQLLKMQEDQLREEQYRSRKHQMFRRTSEDLKSYRDEQPDRPFRKHADSESSVTSLRNTKVASKQLSHYSPPVSRRVPYSFNIPSTSVFANPTNRYNPSYYDSYRNNDNFTRRNFFSRSESVNREEPRSRSNSFNRHEHVLNRHESLSRIDSLQRQESLSRMDSLSIKDSLSRVPRRHSATQQDLSLMRRSPKSQRSDRSSCSRLDDTLPIPVLKAHSPVAKDLKNSVAIDSSKHSSDALRKLEDRWQIPAVQKNIISHGDPFREGHGRSILTQLGAIRMQLQKEQLRMDETLRKRGISQPKAV